MGLASNVLSLMTVTNLLLGLIAYIAVKFAWQMVHYRFFHPLAKFPGPFWGSVTRIWIAQLDLMGTEGPTMDALVEKHGPVLRITPTMLLVTDHEKLPEIYHRNVDKSGHYITGSFGEAESLLNMRSHQAHAEFRKHVGGSYSFSKIKKMEPLIDMRIEEWIRKLGEQFCKSGEAFDFAWWATYMAYDVISEIGFGAPFGFVEKGEDVGGLIQSFHDGMPAFGLLARLHPFTSWVKSTFLKKYLVVTPEDASGIGVLMRFRDRLINQRIEDIKAGKKIGRTDLLQTFLEAVTDEGKPLDLEYLRAELLLVMLAGADTTGTTFQAIIHFLLTHPSAYDRMMEEIDTATRKGLISDMPQYDEVLQHLPFYVGCVKETMRLCPAPASFIPRLVSEPGLDLYGQFVPPGMEIASDPRLVQRDRRLYGDDADEFKPERWLDAEKAMLYNKYNLTFGYGTRGCLGKDIAMMELFKGPLQFFRLYAPKAVPDKPKREFVVKGGVGFWRDVWLTISPRDK